MEVKRDEINLEALTVDDCISIHELMKMSVLIENGKVVALVEEV